MTFTPCSSELPCGSKHVDRRGEGRRQLADSWQCSSVLPEPVVARRSPTRYGREGVLAGYYAGQRHQLLRQTRLPLLYGCLWAPQPMPLSRQVDKERIIHLCLAETHLCSFFLSPHDHHYPFLLLLCTSSLKATLRSYLSFLLISFNLLFLFISQCTHKCFIRHMKK